MDNIKQSSISRKERQTSDIQPKRQGYQNRLLEAESMTLEELRRFALLKYGSYSNFAREIQSSRAQVQRIFTGQYIPKKDSTMEKMAKAIGLSPVLIIKLFRSMQ